MANEIIVSFQPTKTLYALVFNRIGQIWNTSTVAFEAYSTANYANYTIALTQQGTSSPFYDGTFPSAIVAGVYGVVAKQQLGGSAAETDPTVGVQGDFQWNGAFSFPLSDLTTSGQLGQIGPIKLARGVMVQNFPIYLKSAADHVTPFTSGVLSGQIMRDPVSGASFGALQSGLFAELGNGFFSLSALTSGDLLANTIALLFSANGISGGSADPLPMTFILQKTSGAA